jgi:hypothetical protein
MSVVATAQASAVAAAQDEANAMRRQRPPNHQRSQARSKKSRSRGGDTSQAATNEAASSGTEVEVVLVGARGLPTADVFGSSDPYAVATWQRQKVRVRSSPRLCLVRSDDGLGRDPRHPQSG